MKFPQSRQQLVNNSNQCHCGIPQHPNLSDERDLERRLFLPSDEDLERLRFCLLSGEEEGERDLFCGEEPFPDLELDLLEE